MVLFQKLRSQVQSSVWKLKQLYMCLYLTRERMQDDDGCVVDVLEVIYMSDL